MNTPLFARSELTAANVFTMARVVLTPIFAWAWLTGRQVAALELFAAAAATDVIDGFLARYFAQKSTLGAFLDPIADKLLMLVAYTTGMYLGVVPVWFGVTVVGRDAVLAVGVFVVSTAFKGRVKDWAPTLIGKYAVAGQSASVLLAILDDTLAPNGLRLYVQVVMMLTALFTVLALGQYVARSVLEVRGKSPLTRGGGGSA